MGGAPPSLTAITRQTLLRHGRSLVAFSSTAGKRRPPATALRVAAGRGQDVADVIKNNLRVMYHGCIEFRNGHGYRRLLVRRKLAILEASCSSDSADRVA